MADPVLRNTLGQPKVRNIRPPKQFLPIGIQKAYGTAIVRLLTPFFKDVRERLWPALPSILAMAQEELKTDAYGDLISKTMNGVEVGVGIFVPTAAVEGTALTAGIATSNDQRKKADKQVRAVLGVDPLRSERYLAPAMDAFVKQNTALIKTIAPQYLQKVDFIVREGALNGESLATVQGKIVMATKSANTRARTIARDQVGKFNGQLTMLRQQEVGVQDYIWDTQGNERVRGNPTGKYPNAIPSHWARQGKRFKWSKPPEGGHPGQAILCQCIAVPIFSEQAAEEVIAPALQQQVVEPVPVVPTVGEFALSPVILEDIREIAKDITPATIRTSGQLKAQRRSASAVDEIESLTERNLKEILGPDEFNKYREARSTWISNWVGGSSTDVSGVIKEYAEDTGIAKATIWHKGYIDNNTALRAAFLQKNAATRKTFLVVTNKDLTKALDIERALSQQVLKEAFPNGTVKVYRGVRENYFTTNKLTVPRIGDTGEVVTNSLSSWSTNKKTAKDFGGIIMEADVPVDQIFSSFHFNSRLYAEREVIVTNLRPIKYKVVPK